MFGYRLQAVKARAGFTLIEMLVYIALLTIVSGGALTMLFSLSDQINAARVERVLSNSAQTMLERMLLEVRASDLVDIYNSELITSPGELVLTQEATTTVFALSAGAVAMSVDGVSAGQLTSDAVTVDTLRFYHYDNGNTELVRIVVTLTAAIGDTTKSRTFEAATTLRQSYD